MHLQCISLLWKTLTSLQRMHHLTRRNKTYQTSFLTFDGYQVFVAFRTGRLVYIYSEKMGSIRNFSLFLLFVFNTIFNNFTAIYLGSVSLLQKTRVPGEKAIDLPHLTHKLNHIKFRQVHIRHQIEADCESFYSSILYFLLLITKYYYPINFQHVIPHLQS